MNKLKQLLKLARSLWYVRASLLATGCLWFFAWFWSFRSPTYFEWLRKLPDSPLHYRCEALQEFRFLARLEEVVDFALLWLIVFAIFCYVGFTLDAGYKCLRKQQ
jgi:hypothetical protein